LPNYTVFDLKTPRQLQRKLLFQLMLIRKVLDLKPGRQVNGLMTIIMLYCYILLKIKEEYVLLDRKNPEQSINLTKNLGGKFDSLSLFNKKYNQFYLYDASTLTLSKASLNSSESKTVLTRAYAFKAYDTDSFLYVTDAKNKNGKIQYVLKVKDKEYILKYDSPIPAIL
jgi:hypothetical protein